MSAIVFDQISRNFVQGDSGRQITALRGFSLRIDPGEIFALVGLNGAGKTTALKILFGLCRPDSGSIEVLGGKPPLARIGFAPEVPDLPEFLTVDELLAHACRLSGVEFSSARLNRAVQMLSLNDERNRVVEKLSKGTRQRVSLAAAIVHQPELVIFDEPASGLDPLGRRLVKSLIRQLNQEGATVLFTTHILSDLPGLCSRIGVINSGSLLFTGSPAEFCGQEPLTSIEERFSALVAPREVPVQ